MKREMKAPITPQESFQSELKGKHGRTSGPARRSTKGQWTPEEDDVLCKAVERFQGKNWKKIAECFKDRTDVQCLHRWQKVLNPELVKGPWSKEEDNTIIALVEKHGPKKWSTISQHLPGRIGKQCRERWHNHLNPGINKNAWTQEEELILIRAHQIYGNKWAELMKFLPGRSDNSIKNHWNSSVKKKLDSYYASGLLDQCQSSPLIALQNKSIAPSPSWMHSSGDEGNSRPGLDAEESECSQASTVFSQSTNDFQDEVKPGNEEFYMPEFHSGAEQKISNDAAEPYYPPFEDAKIVVPEISCEAECSNSHKVRTTTATEDQLKGVSNDAKQDLDLDLLTHNMNNDGKNQAFQSSVRLSDQPSLPNSETDPEAQTLITDEECCRVLFPDTMKDSCTSSGEQGRNMIEPQKGKGSICSQSAETLVHETGKLPALSWHPSSSEGLAVHNCVPLLDTGLERKPDTNDGFIDTDGHITSHGNDDNDGIPEHQGLSYVPKDSLKLVPLNSFSSPSRVNKIYFPIDDKPAEKDKGALCYEPPRFPSADIPFFSCDLVPSNSDLRQEYSPFGIRQLMISSMNCTTPLRLWDSPCHDRSPDVMLNDAAKSSSNAPSILQKRHHHRDLLSPVLDRRKDKKHKRAATSSLAKDFSCLDVLLDEGDDCMSSRPSESPENKNRCAFRSEAKDIRYAASGQSDQEMIPRDEEPKETLKSSGVTSMQNEKGCNEGGASAKNDQETSGSLVEIRLFSPGMTGCRSDSKVNTSAKDLSNQHKCSLGDIPTDEISSEPPCTVDSSPLSAFDKINSAGTSFDIENFSIFDGTPFRKLLDTPSPWKSPLLFGSFLQSPKLPPEITFEDIGCFMSPGERSYDAIGLMKHLSEHSATAYADALEVLGNDTPETILKKRQLNKSIQGKENHHLSHDQLGNRSQVERRTLDFSDCGTPGKTMVSAASPGGYSSPSSYLLKSCR
ncbi:PREDICTED: myb-related protein 3R-1-like [Camelina sativa]|uniref:Myb-related protein 3R-1-like n=1 Tax=Camelina sativa TaxID=90675 RepID=A0ABM0TWZ9_CAMSA|nr:PREDICTED: myb-related protein 3R-1-like [Camelina sativa]XP_010432673.1 PREDICTED: myb-related protein 3R-1-like [Camelina sativa]